MLDCEADFSISLWSCSNCWCNKDSHFSWSNALTPNNGCICNSKGTSICLPNCINGGSVGTKQGTLTHSKWHFYSNINLSTIKYKQQFVTFQSCNRNDVCKYDIFSWIQVNWKWQYFKRKRWSWRFNNNCRNWKIKRYTCYGNFCCNLQSLLNVILSIKICTEVIVDTWASSSSLLISCNWATLSNNCTTCKERFKGKGAALNHFVLKIFLLEINSFKVTVTIVVNRISTTCEEDKTVVERTESANCTTCFRLLQFV